MEQYRNVIKRVLSRYVDDPETVTAAIFESVDIARTIMGDLPSQGQIGSALQVGPESAARFGNTPPSHVLSKTSGVRTDSLEKPRNTSGPRVIAPPVAGDTEESLYVDHWESSPNAGNGCDRLQSALSSNLPSSIKVDLEGFKEPLTLVRGVATPGTVFVHVTYTTQGDSIGPRVTLMTSQKEIDGDAILADIRAQAAAMYSPTRRVVEPHATYQPPPSSAVLQAALLKDRELLDRDGVGGPRWG